MIAVRKTEADETHTQMIPLEHLVPSNQNPRKTFDEARHKELVTSIGVLGQAQPLVVRRVHDSMQQHSTAKHDQFEIVCGERRWRALKAAGVDEARCEVRDLDDQAAYELAVAENLQRDDLSPLDEARAYVHMMDTFGLTPALIAAKLGKTEPFVTGRMRLVTKLSAKAQATLAKGQLQLQVATLLARLEDHDDQDALLPRLAGGIESHGRMTEPAPPGLARELILQQLRKLRDAPWDLKNAELVPAAGACSTCPKRTAAQTVIFPEALKDDDRCSDGGCWEVKLEQHAKTLIAEQKKKGLPVLEAKKDTKDLWSKQDPTRLAPAAPFVDLDARDTYEFSSGGKTWRDLLKPWLPPNLSRVKPVGAVDPTGKTHELTDKDIAHQVLKNDRADRERKKNEREKAKAKMSPAAGGKKAPAPVPDEDRLDQAEDDAVLEAIVSYAEKHPSDASIWRYVAGDTISAIGSDSRLPRRKGQQHRDLFKKAKTAGELAGLAVEAIAQEQPRGEYIDIARQLGIEAKSAAKKARAEEQKKIDLDREQREVNKQVAKFKAAHAKAPTPRRPEAGSTTSTTRAPRTSRATSRTYSPSLKKGGKK